MPGFPSPFGSDDDPFDAYDEFVPDHLPGPEGFLEGHDVLVGEEHVAFHRFTRDCFEERKVYDMTFDYNLARLNLDARHPSAGFRYAVERGGDGDGDSGGTGDDDSDGGNVEGDVADIDAGDVDGVVDREGIDRVLRAEFTPTTPFCPQTHTLTIGSFRAWNGLSDRHEHDVVRVRAAPIHHQSEAINEQLAALEATYLETGDLTAVLESGAEIGSDPMERSMKREGPGRGSTDAPF